MKVEKSVIDFILTIATPMGNVKGFTMGYRFFNAGLFPLEFFPLRVQFY